MSFLYPLTVLGVVFSPVLWHAGLAGGQALANSRAGGAVSYVFRKQSV